MSNCEAQMSDDHLLMQDIVETCGITVKQLAAETGLAGCTIYRYLEGSATIPSVIWRRLFEKTGDARICQLVTGDSQIVLLKTPGEPCRDQDMIRMLIEERKMQIAFEQEILDCMTDGKIDRADGVRITRIKRWFPESVKALGGLYHAVIDQFERSTKK